MKNKWLIFLVILFAFIFNDLFGQIDIRKNQSDLIRLSLNGNIKSIKTEVFNLILDGINYRVGNKIQSTIFEGNTFEEFDQNGNYNSSKTFLPSGKLIFDCKYFYDKKNRLVKKIESDYYSKTKTNVYDYLYDQKDSLIKLVMTFESNFIATYLIGRDSLERLSTYTILFNDTLSTVQFYSYDNYGNCTLETRYNRDSVLLLKTERTFNKHLLQKEVITKYDFEYYSTDVSHYYYNKDNQNIKIITKIDSEEDTSAYISTNISYYKNGNTKGIEYIPYGGSRLSRIEIETFNEKGERIKTTHTSELKNESNIWQYNYKYDDKGNWIKKEYFKNQEPIGVAIRIIEYFE